MREGYYRNALFWSFNPSPGGVRGGLEFFGGVGGTPGEPPGLCGVVGWGVLARVG